jgi:glycosyltransferase involved in cell wall biosynthesis
VRVLLVNDTRAFAGTERHLIDLALGLTQEGVDVRIACPRDSALWERAAEAGISLHLLEYRGLLDLGATWRLSALIAENRIEVVHMHNGKTAWLGALVTLCRRDFQLIFTQHFLEPAHTKKNGLRKRVWSVAHWWVEQRISQFIAISEVVCEQMLARRETLPAKVTVIPNGTAAPNMEGMGGVKEIRRGLGLGIDELLILCVARLEQEKDCASLVRAMAKVKASGFRARCAIVGGGSELGPLQRLAVELGLEGSVSFVGFQPDAHAWICAADLFVLPSIAEPFGLVLLEAMALGRPVVAIDAGGPQEIVVPGLTGLLTPPQNPDLLAEAIVRLLTNADMRSAMGNAGCQRYLEHFTVGPMAKRTAEVYSKSLATKAGL